MTDLACFVLFLFVIKLRIIWIALAYLCPQIDVIEKTQITKKLVEILIVDSISI